MDSSAKYKRILLVAITRMGDMLQASPMVAGLKEENPGVHITILTDSNFASICTGIPGIDDIFVLDLNFVSRGMREEGTGVVEGFKYLQKAIEQLREREFDFCINMSNSAYTAILIKMLGVKENRGWLSDDEGFRIMADSWAMLFSAFVYHSNREYNGLNLVDVFRSGANVKKHPHSLQYRYTEKGQNWVDEFILSSGLQGDGPLVCVQAGASQQKRQWAPRKFAVLLQKLVEELGARVVLTGSAGEVRILEEILSIYSSPKIAIAAGKTNFDQLGALLAKANVMITGDTGPMHLSVAVGTPVVALFLASALCHETGPYSAGSIAIQPQVSCSPCNPNYPCAHLECHDQISPELVYYMAKLRLETQMGEEKNIEVTKDIAHPRDVIVYRSEFDEDGYLRFVSMNGSWGRHGEDMVYFDSAREAYRVLWKEDFAKIPYQAFPPSLKDQIEVSANFSIGLSETVRLTSEGKKAVEKLLVAIEDVQSPTKLLGELNSRLEQIDKRIEEVGLGYPILGAITRIFVMEKENMRGTDATILASEMGGLYSRLENRSKRFGELFNYFHNKFSEGAKSENLCLQ